MDIQMEAFLPTIMSNLMGHITDCYLQELYSQSPPKCNHMIKLNTPEILLPKISKMNRIWLDNEVESKTRMCQLCTYSFLLKYFNQCQKTKIISYTLQYIIKYPNFAKFMFQDTDIWLLYPSMIHLHYTDMLNHDPSSEESEVSLDGLCQFLKIFILNLPLLQNKHWKTITFKRSFIMRLFALIIQNIEERFQGIIDGPKLNNLCMEMLLVFIAKWLFFFNRYKQRKKHRNKMKQISDQIKEFKRNLKLLQGRNMETIQSDEHDAHFYILAFLTVFRKYTVCIAVIDNYGQKTWNERKKMQTCFRAKCNNTNHVKCKACHIVAYCSRRCAKYDWKYGVLHKQYCNEYKKVIGRKGFDLGKAWW
eukprot:978316_1